MAEEPLKYHVKIRIYRHEKDFGPGTATLMQLVRRTGSLSAACKEMGMAYSKAWKVMKRAEADLGFPLMEGSRGGENGGGTALTEQGEEFLNRYLEFEEEAERVLETLFVRHFGNAE